MTFLSKGKCGPSGTPMTSAKHPSSSKLVTRRSKCLHKKQGLSTFCSTQRICLSTSQTTKRRSSEWEKSRIRKDCQPLQIWWEWMWFMNMAVFGWTSLRSWSMILTGWWILSQKNTGISSRIDLVNNLKSFCFIFLPTKTRHSTEFNILLEKTKKFYTIKYQVSKLGLLQLKRTAA